MLEVRDLCVSYGGINAVKGISFDVPEGEIVTLIGANGAGKSSTLRAICGLVKPASGSIKIRAGHSGMLSDSHRKSVDSSLEEVAGMRTEDIV
ncbi:MAG: ATP-binding cassette domain-containing protein, partial [Blautia sp.]|nr:ATP-binding cassette domain-containing protein [Blautia sp.]